MTAYSFADVSCAISGPGGSFELSELGIADEGITVETNDRTSMQTGADGSGMHTLIVAKPGRVIIRALKNGRVNSVLDSMFNFDNQSAANVGQNTISLRQRVLGDSWVASECAFVKKPNVTYGTQGPINEWVLNCIRIDGRIGGAAGGAA